METTNKSFRKRNAILTCLQGTHLHPSAEMVHEMLREEHPDISLATVYRNLTHFKNQGQIVSVATVRGVERFDAEIDAHVHFICSNCDAVIDLPQIPMPRSMDGQIHSSSGCKVESCQLTYMGLCSECQSKN